MLSPGYDRPRHLEVLLLAAVVLAVLARNAGIFIEGRFWAEEGRVFFAQAYGQPIWPTVIEPYAGYYSLFNRLAAEAAATLPLRLAPIFLSTLCLLVVCANIVILLRGGLLPSRWSKAVGAAVVLVAPPNAEIWMNSTGIHFHLGLGAALILAAGAGGVGPAFRAAYLTVAVLTGPVTAILAPFFLLRAWKRPGDGSRREAAIVTAGAVLQTVLFLMSLASKERPGAFAADVLALAGFVKMVVLPWLGHGPAMALSRAVTGEGAGGGILAAAPGLGACLALAWVIGRDRVASALAGIGLLVGLVSLAGALGQDPRGLLHPYAGGRYVYVPNVLVALALLSTLARPVPGRVWRWVGGLLLAVFCLNGAAIYARADDFFFTGPSWPAELGRWSAEGGDGPLRIWPEGWDMVLRKQGP